MSDSKIKIYCTTCGKELNDRDDRCCLQVEDDCYIQQVTVVLNRPIEMIDLKIEVNDVLEK